MKALLRIALLLAVTALLATAQTAPRAGAETLEADLATHHVAVKTDFAGVKVLLFGAVLDDEIVQLAGPRDIIIVIRGPRTRTLVRRKKKVAGIWINSDPVAFENVPGYYAIVSNRPAEDIASSYVLHDNGIGLNALKADVILSAGGFSTENAKAYADAIVRVRTRDQLYQRLVGGVSFSRRHLFRAEFELPANVPLGEYSADVFIFRAGKVVTKSSTSLVIEKSGLEKLIYNMAHQQPFLYGVLAVLAAGLAGLAAAAVFRKV